MSGKYDDIIRLPHHQSAVRPHMKPMDRAAQFSPFAALTGHSAAIRETARLTNRRIELTEDAVQRLDEELRWLRERIDSRPEAEITYFLPDGRKDGGSYVTAAGVVKQVRTFERVVVMEDGTVIPIGDIVDLAGPDFFGEGR